MSSSTRDQGIRQAGVTGVDEFGHRRRVAFGNTQPVRHQRRGRKRAGAERQLADLAVAELRHVALEPLALQQQRPRALDIEGPGGGAPCLERPAIEEG